MLTSQSFKFSIQSESLTDPKVKNRNENELCRIAKTLLASFSLDHYCHVIFIAFPLCWSYLLLTGSRNFPIGTSKAPVKKNGFVLFFYSLF